MTSVPVADTMAVSQTVLASGQANTDTMISLTAILAVALLAPILSFMTGKRIPAVVFLIVLGVIIGPSVWGLAEIDSGISILRQLGLGMLFLLAGYDLAHVPRVGIHWCASFPERKRSADCSHTSHRCDIHRSGYVATYLEAVGSITNQRR